MEAAKKLTRQMIYEAKFVAISHYYGSVLKQSMTKKRMRDEKIMMPKQHFMDVSNLSFPLICAKDNTSRTKSVASMVSPFLFHEDE